MKPPKSFEVSVPVYPIESRVTLVMPGCDSVDALIVGITLNPGSVQYKVVYWQ